MSEDDSTQDPTLTVGQLVAMGTDDIVSAAMTIAASDAALGMDAGSLAALMAGRALCELAADRLNDAADALIPWTAQIVADVVWQEDIARHDRVALAIMTRAVRELWRRAWIVRVRGGDLR